MMMDIEDHDERVPVAASLSVPVVLIGVPDDPAGLLLRRPRLRGGGAARRGRARGHRARRARLPGLPGGGDGSRSQLHPPLRGRVRGHARAPACRTDDRARRARPGGGRCGGGAGAGELGDGRLGLVVPNSRDPSACAARAQRPRRRRGARHLPHRDCAPIARPRRWSRRTTNVSRSRATSRDARWRRCSGCSSRVPGPPPPAIDLVAPRLTRRQTVMAPPRRKRR